MTALHFVRLDDCPPRPWRNGGGRTRELLAWPDPDDWRLRLSVARIETDGPFSAFPEVERWFVVLSGTGVRLDLPGEPSASRALTPADPPIAFAGEAAPQCRLIEGPTEDLNVMVRRGAGAALLRRAAPGDSIDGPARWRALFAAEPAQLCVDNCTQALAAGTLAWSDAGGAGTWTLVAGRHAFWATLARAEDA